MRVAIDERDVAYNETIYIVTILLPRTQLLCLNWLCNVVCY